MNNAAPILCLSRHAKGARADCTQASALIDGFEGEHLLADRAYDQEILPSKITIENCGTKEESKRATGI